MRAILDPMNDAAQAAIDKALGTGLAVVGSAGLTLQWWSGFGSAVLIAINILLAFGGFYLLILRIRRAKQEIREAVRQEELRVLAARARIKQDAAEARATIKDAAVEAAAEVKSAVQEAISGNEEKN